MGSPSPTLLLLSHPPAIFCGINLLTFTTNPKFQGIKNIPPGWHLLYVSETADVSLREGFWFYVPNPSSYEGDPPLLVYVWDRERGGLVPCRSGSDDYNRYHSETIAQERLTPYRQSAAPDGEEQREDYWPDLTRQITPALLTRFTGNSDWKITTASSAPQDRDDIPGLSATEARFGDEESELGVLGIDLKRTWREGAIGRERTEGRLDTSWTLENVVCQFADEMGEGARWGTVMLGEMEVAFLLVLTVANWSCLEEWKRCVGIVLGCKTAIITHEPFFTTFLSLLQRQLERCEDVEGGLFDMSDDGAAWLKGLLKTFKRTLGEVFGEGEGEGGEVKEQMGELEEWARGAYGWEVGGEFVRKGMLELEDGEVVEMEVEEMEGDGEEERGEYAPVVVEL